MGIGLTLRRVAWPCVRPAIDWSPRVRRFTLSVFALSVFVAAAFYAVKASESGSAIIRWRTLIDHAVRGDNVYNEPGLGGSFPNPPILAIMLWPLTLLPPVASALVWFFVKVAMAACSIYWTVRLATGDSFRLPAPGFVVLLLLVARPLLGDLQHGNVNILILFLVTAGLWAARTQRDWYAGLAIGLATAVKVTPALFVPYFAYKRQWKIVVASLCGLGVFLFFVPGCVLGFERNWWLVRSWCGAMVLPYLIQGQVETLQVNQSLPALLLRLFTDAAAIELSDGVTLTVNWLSLDRAAVLWIAKIICGALVLWIAFVSRTATDQRANSRLSIEHSLVLIAMLLISERSWKHHFVTMTLPYAVLVASMYGDAPAARRRWIIAVLAASFLCMASTSSEFAGWWGEGLGHKYAQAFGMFTASAVVAGAALSTLLLSPRSGGRHVCQANITTNDLTSATAAQSRG